MKSNFQVLVSLVAAFLCFTVTTSTAVEFEYTRCARPGVVAITFDDGPYKYTPAILDLLKEKKVTSAFFINGDNFMSIYNETYQAIIRRAISEGHTIGHHTWLHPNLNISSPEEIKYQMNHLTEELMRLGLLDQKPAYMRPPYGSINAEVVQIIAELGYNMVNWSIDTWDWSHPGNTTAGMEEYVSKLNGTDPSTTPGFIVLHHDVQFGCVELASAAIDYVRSQGYRLVSLNECLELQLDNIPGTAHSQASSQALMFICISLQFTFFISAFSYLFTSF